MKTLFAGGRVFDGRNSPTAGRAVLVSDGRIEALAPEGDFDGFDGRRVDCRGATLMPGLIDCHVHLTMGV